MSLLLDDAASNCACERERALNRELVDVNVSATSSFTSELP